LRVFENSLLRRTCGLEEELSDRRLEKLHTEQLHNLYSSPKIRVRWARNVARTGELKMEDKSLKT
jgi:hypothetical protein